MASITLSEVKALLRLQDAYVYDEKKVLQTTNKSFLSQTGDISILRVSADTLYDDYGTTIYPSSNWYTSQDVTGRTYIRRVDTGAIDSGSTVWITYSVNSSYDDLIDRLIPIVERDILSYLGNHFEDKNTEYEAGHFVFVEATSSTNAYITDTQNSFTSRGFQDNMDIYIGGTDRNEGMYTISSENDSRLLLSDNDTLLDERSTKYYGHNYICISRIKWPLSLKPIIAQIIWHTLDKAKSGDVASKSLGPASISYFPIGSGSFPPHIYQALSKFKNVSMK